MCMHRLVFRCLLVHVSVYHVFIGCLLQKVSNSSKTKIDEKGASEEAKEPFPPVTSTTRIIWDHYDASMPYDVCIHNAIINQLNSFFQASITFITPISWMRKLEGSHLQELSAITVLSNYPCLFNRVIMRQCMQISITVPLERSHPEGI